MSHTKCKQMELQCQIAGEEHPSQPFFKQISNLFSFSVGKNMEKSRQFEVVSSPLLACTLRGLDLGPQVLWQTPLPAEPSLWHSVSGYWWNRVLTLWQKTENQRNVWESICQRVHRCPSWSTARTMQFIHLLEIQIHTWLKSSLFWHLGINSLLFQVDRLVATSYWFIHYFSVMDG